ncbi:MAG TPA: MBL fold metallo-hydrolase [Terriglobia bacterium]|nr:MBL fold metallo-hydrolase [Terriglobia bacterium]
MSLRVCVLASGSHGNSTWIATERTCLLVDAGLSKKETCARLEAVGERFESCDAFIISHEHIDHVGGLKRMARDLGRPIYINAATRDAIDWGKKITAFEMFTAGGKLTIGDIEVTPFSIPHDAADPVGFTFAAEGLKIAVVTDLGCVPEHVKQHLRGCHMLVFESNHDVEMLRVGPYPWFVKQRVMSRHGHLSNNATAEFLTSDYDGCAQVLVLAHLSEINNHPEIVRLTALEALSRRRSACAPELHLATQNAPTKVFRW